MRCTSMGLPDLLQNPHGTKAVGLVAVIADRAKLQTEMLSSANHSPECHPQSRESILICDGVFQSPFK